MNKQKTDRLSFKEAMAYTRRGYAIWWKYCPDALIVRGAKEVVAALTPYLPLYFTARLVNAIIGGGGAEQVRP